MNKIKYNDLIYDIIDIINVGGTYHLIIKRGNDVTYINKIDNRYVAPPTNLSLYKNKHMTLDYLRKQYLLQLLIKYIKDNDMYSNIHDVTEAFKEYVKTSYAETFMYWPFMENIEFDSELHIVANDLEMFLDKKLHNRVLAPDNETIIIIDNYVPTSKFIDEDDLVPDPSFKK